MKFDPATERKPHRRAVITLCSLVVFGMVLSSASGSRERIQSNNSNCLAGQETSICCCAAAKNECRCSECACHQDKKSDPLKPALPPTEKTELVYSLELEDDIAHGLAEQDLPRTVRRCNVLATSSAQETCALLSRFRC